MIRRAFLLFAVLFFVLTQAQAFSFGGGLKFDDEPEFLDPEAVLMFDPAASAAGEQIQGHVADGYYVYRQSLKLEDAAGHQFEPQLSSGQLHTDEFFGESEIYRFDELVLTLPDDAAGALKLHWQGCADGGICYPPQVLALDIGDDDFSSAAMSTGSEVDFSATSDSRLGALFSAPKQALASADGPGSAQSSPEVMLAEDEAAAHHLAHLGPWNAALLFFGFGLLLAFTPCTLPMIPIVSTLIVGSQARPRRALALTFVYVLVMAATYAAVGVAAGLAGANLQAALQSPWLLGAFAALFVLLAISLFGAFELQLPQGLVNRLNAAGRNHEGGHLGSAAALGFLSALLVGPCMTAPLAGALIYIGQNGSPVVGGAALFALGLGMGLPLLLIAVFGARILPRPGPWMERVRVAFGYVMLGMAVYLISPFLPPSLSLFLWGALGLSLCIGLLGWMHAVTLKRRLGWSLGFGSTLVGVWSLIMLVGAASGGASLTHPLEHLALGAGAPRLQTADRFEYVAAKSVQDVNARIAEAGAQGKWTLIDFYADWCVSCHVNERNVFQHPEVSARLAQMQILRPDVTRNDALDRELMKNWRVMGPPTMILVGPDGQEVRAQRMVGELSVRDFLARLDQAGA